MLRTQVDPYVLVGDLADLPNPADVAQGTLFHAEDTGDCRILVINPISQIRYWDPFCGTSSASGVGSVFFQKFSAVVPVQTGIGLQPIFLSDNMPQAPSTTLVGYSFPEPASVGQMFVDVIANAAVSLSVAVILLKNGSPMATLVIPPGGTGLFRGPGPAVPFAQTDKLDIAVENAVGSGGSITLSVMVAVTVG